MEETTYTGNLDGCGDRRYRAWPVAPGWEGVTDTDCPLGCGGTVRWDEAGRVPGARRCDRCAARFLGLGPAGLGPNLLVLTDAPHAVVAVDSHARGFGWVEYLGPFGACETQAGRPDRVEAVADLRPVAGVPIGIGCRVRLP